jgi:hypothetical protein
VILMGVGLVGLLFTVMIWGPRRRQMMVERQPGRTVYTEQS